MHSSYAKVSVLVPTYNYGRYLPQTLNSILAQEDVDFELLVSDDASTDNSAEIIRSYARRDKRIRFKLHEKNLGMVENWNWCLKEARGEYIKYVFGDDALTSRQSLGRFVYLLDLHPEATIATSSRLIVNDASTPTEIWDDLRFPGVYTGQSLIYRCLWQDRNLIGEPTAVMVRRSAIGRPFDVALRQLVDMEMWFYLLSQGDLVYEPTPLCAFRSHDQQQTIHNRHSHVGPQESLRITARYFAEASECATASWHPLQRRQIIYRRLYYSAKRVARTPEVISQEAVLNNCLTPPWRLACWGLHRMGRPFKNLGYALSKRANTLRLRPRPRDLDISAFVDVYSSSESCPVVGFKQTKLA
ncbi:MAG TPA: glycosyltransferase family 2 protein [Opitutaceae bacterium]|nr:glycosyltransferase family 2 protein [Opitutaceae bacterium]